MLNPRRGTFLVMAFGVSFALFSANAVAESRHSGKSDTEEASDEASCEGGKCGTEELRPVADAALKPYLKELLAEKFWLPEKFVEKRYAESFPKALTAATQPGKKKDVDGLVDINVELMSTLNETQLGLPLDEENPKGLHKFLIDMVKAEDDKKLEPSDEKYALLPTLEHLLWSVEEIGGKVNTEERAEAYKAKFKEKFKSKVKENEEIKKLVADASSTNDATKKEAQAKLREKVNREAFAGFIAGQRKSGKGEEADKLAAQMGWWDKDAKQTVFDFNNGGSQERLFGGATPSEAGAAISAYHEANKKTGAPVLEQYLNPDPSKAKTFYQKDGSIVAGLPAGVKPPGAPAAAAQERATPRGQTFGQAAAANSAAGGGGEAAALAKLTSSQPCAGCHKGTSFSGSSLKDLSLTGGEKPGKKAAGILAAIESVPQMQSLKNDPAVMSALQEWKKAQSGI